MDPAVEKIDLVVMGDCCPDIVLTGERVRPTFGQVETLISSYHLTLGGSGAITACRAVDLGMKVALVSVVGSDLFGSHVIDLLLARGVDTSAVRIDDRCPTGATIVLSEPADRAMLTAPGAIRLLTESDVPAELLTRARHVHVSSYFLQTGLRQALGDLLETAKQGGASTSLDPNWDPAEEWSGLDQILETVDVLSLNAAEARHLTGSADTTTAAVQLARRASTVVVKQGAEAALAVSQRRCWSVVPPSLTPVDTIGAGDSFVAGFIRSLTVDRSVAEALKLACAVGSLSTLGVGGIEEHIEMSRAREVAGQLAVTHRTPHVA